MNVYTVVLYVGRKPVGMVEGILADSKRSASKFAVRRYREAKNLPPSFAINTRTYQKKLEVGQAAVSG